MGLIKANELRIGNIFDYHGVDVIVLAVDRYKATFGYFTDSFGFERKYDDIDFPKPIPITVSNLMKFNVEGGIDHNGLGDYVILRLSKDYIYDRVLGGCFNSFVLFKMTNKWSIKYISPLFGSDLFHRDFEYIHQFQNLSYSLTGQELQLTNSNTTL